MNLIHLFLQGEDSCLKDKLLDGGMRGNDKKGIGYREVRQYHTDFYFLQFVFMTRCYNTYVESVISKFESAEQKPDVIIVNSCLWDITRYFLLLIIYQDCIYFAYLLQRARGRRGRDRIVVGFTISCAIGAYQQ